MSVRRRVSSGWTAANGPRRAASAVTPRTGETAVGAGGAGAESDSSVLQLCWVCSRELGSPDCAHALQSRYRSGWHGVPTTDAASLAKAA